MLWLSIHVEAEQRTNSDPAMAAILLVWELSGGIGLLKLHP
jgi:hypothetical protein